MEERIVSSAAPVARPAAETARALRRLLGEGAALRPAGEAREDPDALLRRYRPRAELRLFGTRFFLSGPRQNEWVRFFVAYVVQGPDPGSGRGARVWPRLFYKDVSLVWRCASHRTRLGGELWIGKGAVESVVEDGEEVEASMEATTDLPLELQTALEDLNHAPPGGSVPTDERALALVLRRRPDGGIEPYRDFTAPRERAWADPRNRVNGGRPVARFARRGDPESLRFVRGYEPDFARGVLEVARGSSSLYGGPLRRFRILSANRRIQWQFMAAPRHVWIIPPQATTTELSSYGVRTVDVRVDEDLCIPGYEYHFVVNEDEVAERGAEPVWYSQIPEGYAGEPSPLEDGRADASPWLERIPVIRAFRRAVLGPRGR